MRDRLFTIGYEGRSLDEFIAIAREAGVRRVVDVRALPLSRRKGFSKTPLKQALADSGIEYVHVRAAGNPFRDQRGDIVRCLANYRHYLSESPSVLEELEANLGDRSALLCMEMDHRSCHRSIIADGLKVRNPGVSLKHL